MIGPWPHPSEPMSCPAGAAHPPPLAVAGIAWPLVAIPGMPSWYAAVAIALGIVAEGAPVIWLLLARS